LPLCRAIASQIRRLTAPRLICVFAIAARHAALPDPLVFIFFEILSFSACVDWHNLF
jgi:hypothetical protein